MSEVVVVLPAYNEASRLEALLDRIRAALDKQSYRIVVVDDGSRDATPEILQRCSAELPMTIITHAVNRGLAETLYDGLRWVAEHSSDDDIVVMMDADDTHNPAYIDDLVRRIRDGYDVVIASRFRGTPVVGVPAHRRLFSYGVFMLLRVLMPIPGVRDYACGYRAIRARLVRQAVRQFGDQLFELRQWGFICTAELLWKLRTLGARCSEIPFELRYDLKESPSRMRAMRTIAGYGLLAWKSRFARRQSLRGV
jgi:dolichol-phosphate mannosyltransferase